VKLLLDENLPEQLKNDFFEYEIYHITDLQWNGIKNGELLKLMLAENFDVLLTFDKNLRYQQNLQKYPIAVFVLVAQRNQYRFLVPLVDKIKTHLNSFSIGATIIGSQLFVVKTDNERISIFIEIAKKWGRIYLTVLGGCEGSLVIRSERQKNGQRGDFWESLGTYHAFDCCYGEKFGLGLCWDSQR